MNPNVHFSDPVLKFCLKHGNGLPTTDQKTVIFGNRLQAPFAK